jgi:tripartite ATP-independent transporter DctM subunit
MAIAGLMILLLCLLLVAGVPMVAALSVAVIVDFELTGVRPETVTSLLNSALSKFVFIALPMFVLMGTIMNAGGISGRLFDFAKALVGWLRGGLAQVNVLTSMFFGGMIGSSTADLAGTGSIIIPAMKREGYKPEIAAAVTASSAGVGPMIPPSSPMILYSAVTGTSLGALFLAGLIPGILLGLMLMSIVGWMARKHGWQQSGAFDPREVLRTGAHAILPFGVPVIVVGGFVLGIFTPTESSVFAVAFAMFLSVVVYRKLSLRGLYRVFGNALQLAGELKMITAMSLAFGWGLSNAGVPQAIVGAIDFILIYDSLLLRLTILVLLAIVAGMFLDPLIPVLLPIILPVLIFYNIDLVHFGVLMVICVVIGQVTPPLAIALVITAKLAQTDQMAIFRANVPFLIGLIIFLGFLMVFPGLATWLPSLVQGR